MKMVKIVAAIVVILTVTAFSDVGYVKRYLGPLIDFSREHHANLLIYDQYDQTRGLAVLTPGKVVDLPTELKSFTKPKSSRAAPSLSPDGAQVAFAQSGSENDGQQEIWIFDLRSGSSSKVAQFPGVLSVAWSPTGDMLAVNTGRGQLRTLVLATKESKLIATDISSDVASWSPDGHEITYESASGTGESRDFHVNVIDVATGQITKIADGRSPSWSPRGDQIAFLDPQEREYWTISPGGGSSDPLIRGSKKVKGDPILSEPVVWSPDGRYVVIIGYYDGGTMMTLVDLSTSKQTLLDQGGDWLLATWR
jgi:Tol biopolymer transport system component